MWELLVRRPVHSGRSRIRTLPTLDDGEAASDEMCAAVTSVTEREEKRPRV
jgi:hypothetical protein